jgi:hypothetical protein
MKLETNKNHYKEEFGYHLLLSLLKSKTYCAIGTLLKTNFTTNSFFCT